MKICKCCGRLLPDTEFTKHQSRCKYCRRIYRLFHDYGLTEEQYLQMWKEQNGKCKLCGKELKEHYLDVDHDHKTGKVRGLLCRGCNLMLDEMFEHNITEGQLRSYLDNGQERILINEN